ncbi:MarR family winged helix-turn-helix transcriptional regulator [Paenibacillus campinasensis]|uniref:MarR family winged helix-turn-helix transcriptional regulator n=1 Tax=Paenibacillus campinasensis TaxID=66347 RepID=UPI001FD4C670|nr:MarR family transcriptional regulator [Paenibacillus campinasensis]
MQALGDRLDQHVTVKQWLLIAILFKSMPAKLAVKEIASIVGATHQNVMQMARSLESKGFLEISIDPEDQRIRRIGLTQQCLDYFRTREDKETAFLNDLFTDFNGEELAQFHLFIERLLHNISNMEARSSGDGA